MLVTGIQQSELVIHIHASGTYLVAQVVENLPVRQEIWVQSLGQEGLLEKRNGCPLQYSCLEKSTDREAWQATVHGVTKSLPQLSQLGFLGDSLVENLPANLEDVGLIPGLRRSLEKEMAVHSSILAWEIPWIEDPGRLHSVGSQKSWT